MDEHMTDTHMNSKEIDNITTLQGGIQKRIEQVWEGTGGNCLDKQRIQRGPLF